MNTRARSTRKAKDAASHFVKRVTSGRNASSPTPEKDILDSKSSKQKQVNIPAHFGLWNGIFIT